jgi:hypothetical protein
MGQLNGSGAIFLSAGVPDPSADHFVREGDLAAITAAVSALIYVCLGRRRLIWGGHPAITPMIWQAFDSMGADYSEWVRLYQSAAFDDEFPDETKRFRNVVVTDGMGGDKRASLGPMRRRMLSEQVFEAAVFVGGMRGILEEYALIKELAPDARVVPIASTLGATVDVALTERVDVALFVERDYIALLHDQLGIDPNEIRYRSPRDQPVVIAERIKRPTKGGHR